MTEPLTPESLAELRRLLDAATARPWMVDDEGDDVAVIVDDGDDSSFIQIAGDLHQGRDGLGDACLIAAAVNALDALLDAADERDKLRDELAGLAREAVRSELRDPYNDPDTHVAVIRLALTRRDAGRRSVRAAALD